MATIGNTYRQLLDLLPESPLQVGDVVAVNGSRVSVELPSGDVIDVRGDGASIGQRLFVRDKQVEATAPTLPVVLIDV